MDSTKSQNHVFPKDTAPGRQGSSSELLNLEPFSTPLIAPIVVIIASSGNNPHASHLSTGYYYKSTCECYCNPNAEPYRFCAMEEYYPYLYYCTDGSTKECDVRRYRDFYIQAEKVDWDYLPSGTNKVDNNNDYLLDSLINGPNRVGSVYSKCIYKRYTDWLYVDHLPSDPSQGFVGPLIRCEVGDVIRVHLRNLCPHEVSIHPHGVHYNKKNEGAFYTDDTSGNKKKDDRIPYGFTKTVEWSIPEEFGPRDDDPNCLPMAYHSHNLPGLEINAGLLGLIIVCKPGTLNGAGRRKDVDREHVLYLDSIDEGHSFLFAENIARCGDPATCQSLWDNGDAAFEESMKKDSINGYMYANGPPFQVLVGERVAWYIFALEAELHALEIHGHTLELKYTRTTTLPIFPATFMTAQTVSTRPGYWLISCRNAEHNRNGMNAYLNVEASGSSVVEQLGGVTRNYYLAAEQISWNYGPSGQNLYDGGSLTAAGSDSEVMFLSDANHIGGIYEKGIFVEYTDATFSTSIYTPIDLGILGPVLKGEVGDTIVVTLKNYLTFNVSLYLQGVSFPKSEDGLWEKGASGTLGGKIVTPGSTETYTYTIPWTINLGQDDPMCRASMYYSDIESERDQNTGLLGPTLICKKGGLDPLTNRQKYIDREFYLLFADMDENLSWLFDVNSAGVTTTAPDFEESNVMRSINGYSYGNLQGLDMCLGETVSWHVLSSGGNEGLHSAVFNGHNLLIDGINRNSRLTIPEVTFYGLMRADFVGNWSVRCGNNDHFDKGEKAIYTVGLCGASPPTLYDTSAGSVTRTYYIGVVEDEWHYSPYHTIHPITEEDYSVPGSSQYNRVRTDAGFIGPVYKKALYKEYTDNSFTTEIPKSDYLGLLGPMMHVQVGDIVKVVFKNMASRPYSLHGQGMRTAKEYEGALYQDGETSGGDSVAAGATFTYYWEVDESAGPTVTGPNCLGSIYHSAVNPSKDVMSGLIGPLIICKAGILDENNQRHDYVSREYPLLMLAINENLSWYIDDNIATYAPTADTSSSEFEESNMYDSVNGLIYNNVPNLNILCGEWAAWYVMGAGANEDLHQMHFHGQMSIYRTTREHLTDVIEVVPHTVETIEMFATNPGRWLAHCHFGVHTLDGMVVTFLISC